LRRRFSRRNQEHAMTNTDIEYRIRAVEATILTIRGQKVILDADLAHIYGVPTRRLNERTGKAQQGTVSGRFCL